MSLHRIIPYWSAEAGNGHEVPSTKSTPSHAVLTFFPPEKQWIASCDPLLVEAFSDEIELQLSVSAILPALVDGALDS